MAEQGRFVSGEAVELDIRVALVGSRMLAFLIDLLVEVGLLIGLYVASVMLTLLLLASDLADLALLIGLITVSGVLAFVIYPATLETLTGGRSLGKLAVGLRVVRDDSGPIRFRHSLVRVLVGFAVDFPGLALPPVTWLVSLWTALANPYGKRLGDLAAGTIVIHDRAPTSWGWSPPTPPHLLAWSATLDLSRLDDELALAVRGFLSRTRKIREPSRGELCQRLAHQVALATSPPPPPGVAPWVFLAAVLAERNRRETDRLTKRRRVVAQLWPNLGTTASHSAPLGATPQVGASPPGELAGSGTPKPV